jgi:DNA invertase Pin-like site-specific DNA recombinase
MIVGYVRVSTDRQGANGLGATAQTDAIRARFPHARIVTEVASGGKHRPELEQLLSALTDSDTLVLAKLDRLGRSTIDVISKLTDLTDRGVTLVVLDLGLDTSTAAGKFAATVLAAAAELERNLISQRTKDALAAARRRGIVPGPKVDESRAAAVRAALSGGATPNDVVLTCGVSRSTVYRIIKDLRDRPITD